MHGELRAFTEVRFRLCVLVGALAATGCASARNAPPNVAPTFVNPPSLVRPSGYTHVVVGPDERTVYIAGQVAFDSTGKLVGAGDFRAQAEQVYANLGRALASVGGDFSHLVKTTTFIVDVRTNGAVLREVRTRYLNAANPPANTLAPVPELARPDLLIEIEAVAILPLRPAGRSGAQSVAPR